MTDASPVDWGLAERVAIRAAGREPFSASYLADSLQSDFEEATAQAEDLVAEATGLRSLSGPARARVTDRAGWVHANVNSFQRLLRPLTDKLGDRMSEGIASGVTRRFAGAEVGMLLGWMSTRVLGQYDLLVVEDPTDTAPDDQDLVYYVGPNVLALEKRFAFHRRSSGSGWRSTRSPTGRSSPACRGFASTTSVSCRRRSTRSILIRSGSSMPSRRCSTI